MTIDNTKLFSPKSAISRKNYFINFVIIYLIYVSSFLGLNILFDNFFVKKTEIIITILISILFFILFFFNAKKRIYDIKNGKNIAFLTTFMAILTAVFCSYPFLQFHKTLNLICVIIFLSLSFLKGKIIPIKENIKNENADNSNIVSFKKGISKRNFIANNFLILSITAFLFSLQGMHNYYYGVSEYNYHTANLIIFTILFSFNIKKRFFDIKNGENCIKQTILISVLGVLTLCFILFNLHLGIICTLIAFLLMNIIYLSVKNGKYVEQNNSKMFNFTAFLCPYIWAIFNRIKEPLYIAPIFVLGASGIYSLIMFNTFYYSLKETLFIHDGIMSLIYNIISIIILQIYYGIKANEWFDIEYKNEDKKQKNIAPLILIIIMLLLALIFPFLSKLYIFKTDLEHRYDVKVNISKSDLQTRKLTFKDYEIKMKENKLKTWKDLENYKKEQLNFTLNNWKISTNYKKEGNTYIFYITPEYYNENPFIVKLLYYANNDFIKGDIAGIESIKSKKWVDGWNMQYKVVYRSTVDDELLIDCNLQTLNLNKKPTYIDAYKAMKSCKIKNYTKDVNIKNALNFTKREQERRKENNKNLGWI